jgi:hypothetical protein
VGLADIILIAKKILVGLVIAIVPLIILIGGLWITQKRLPSSHSDPQSPATQAGPSR